MKATLKFNLPEDSQEFEQCSKASDLSYILWQMAYNVKRSLLKHTNVSDEYANGVEAVYKELYELLEEYNINLDKLTS